MRRYREVLGLCVLGVLGAAIAGWNLGPATGNQFRSPTPPPPDDGKLRIIVFGAHPDDCEFRAGGVAAMWAAQGHHVKSVSVCNGDLGHYKMSGGPLARRRLAEVQHCAEILGVQTQVLDIHDGELIPPLRTATP